MNNSVSSVTSEGALLTVNLKPVSPTIASQPRPLIIPEGQPAAFGAAAIGTAPLTYQWLLNGNPITGATSANFTIPSTSVSNAGTYSVLVKNPVGSVTSDGALLTVNPKPVGPTLTKQPAPLTIAEGQSASFTVTASGTAPFGYQWRMNGAPIAGATSGSYTIPNATIANSGTYSVVVQNAVSSVTSQGALLTVNPKPVAPTLTMPPLALAVTEGQPASFTVAATGTMPLTFQWYFNGIAIPGENSDAYIISKTSPAYAGGYYVSVKNSVGEVKSTTVTLKVQALPDVAPANLLGKSYNVTITSGFAPFASSGSFRAAAAMVGNKGVLVPLSGEVDADIGTYTYQKTAPNAGKVVLSSSDPADPYIIYADVIFTTARTGTYFATRNDSLTATQTGTFTETTPANQPASNFAPASIAGKTITVGITGASGPDGLFADYGALRTTFSSSGNRATLVPITANLDPNTATYTYTKTSGVSGTSF